MILLLVFYILHGAPRKMRIFFGFFVVCESDLYNCDTMIEVITIKNPKNLKKSSKIRKNLTSYKKNYYKKPNKPAKNFQERTINP
jgi:hypothetical protein